MEAAAPVVTIEVNTWPPLCNGDGEPAESSDVAWDGTDGLPRRDANAFVRGMRRYARIDKLDDICADAGGSLADTPEEARYALWYGVEGACRDALAAVEVQGLDPKDAQVCVPAMSSHRAWMRMCGHAAANVSSACSRWISFRHCAACIGCR